VMGPALVVAPAAMLVALAVDSALGEPPAATHPVVFMGKFLRRWGRGLPDKAPRAAFMGGAGGWLIGAVVCTGIAWIAASLARQWLAPSASWIRAAATALVYGMLLKPLLAWALLRSEVQAVEAAVAEGVDAARARVALLASRNTRELSELQVRETAIESLAENLNDSVIAPLFWFAVAGLPGAALYRFANTADAMWGYRDRWEWAGKWAAHADDVLSWIPARLTAAVLLGPRHWGDLRREARRTASPNGGWPMSAMALRLGVRLGKPGVYLLNARGRSAAASDTARAVRLAAMAIALVLPPLACLTLFIGDIP
jgi:adenosylcobinamide-phosphate synthase